MNNNQQSQSGMVIVLAILIIAAVLSTAVILGDLVVREIRQTRLVDQSIQAYYLAESGSERALHQVRQREGVVDCNILDGGSGATCSDINSRCSNNPLVPCVNTNGADLGDWEVIAIKEPETVIILNEGQTFQVDLFDTAQTSDSGVNRIEIGSDLTVTSLLGELTNLSNVLNISGNCPQLPNEPVLKDFLLITTLNNPLGFGALAGVTIEEECSYIFKLNFPSNNDGNQESAELTIKVFNTPPTTNQIDIPSRLIIDTDAIFGDSFQSVRVRTPIRPPLSGLYDFVLFSAEDLDKSTQ